MINNGTVNEINYNSRWTSPINYPHDCKLGILKKILQNVGFLYTLTPKKGIVDDSLNRNKVSKTVSFNESLYYTATENNSENTDPILCKVKIYDTATTNRPVIKNITKSANSSRQITTNKYETAINITKIDDTDLISNQTIFEELSSKTCNRSGMCITEEYEDEFVKAMEGIKTSTVAKRSPINKEYNFNFFVKNDLDGKNIYQNKTAVNRSVEEKFVVNLYESLGRKSSPRINTFNNINASYITKIEEKPVATILDPPTRTRMKFEPPQPDNKMFTFLTLKQEADVQCEIMRQASKALEICNSQKNRVEQVELERVLLIAGYKHHAIIEQMRENEYSEVYQEKSKGIVSIKNLEFPLRKCGSKKQCLNEWYICIMSTGTDILYTKCAKRTNNDTVVFSDVFIFDNLKSNFVINVSIYRMALESERRVKNPIKLRNTSCSSYKKIFHKSLHTYEAVKSDILISSFKRHGFTQLRRSDFFRQGPWVLQNIPVDSSVKAVFYATLNVDKVEIESYFSGFLTIATGNVSGWTRRWCVLDGTHLQFWNSPSEEGLNRPILIFDLKDCSVPAVLLADRMLCPRSRTLYLDIDTANGRKFNCRLYLSADNVNDMKLWKCELNAIIRSLGKWKMFNY